MTLLFVMQLVRMDSNGIDRILNKLNLREACKTTLSLMVRGVEVEFLKIQPLLQKNVLKQQGKKEDGLIPTQMNCFQERRDTSDSKHRNMVGKITKDLVRYCVIMQLQGILLTEFIGKNLHCQQEIFQATEEIQQDMMR